MVDLETRIGRTLRLVREALRAIEADPAVFREAIEHVEKANCSPLAVPKDKPDAVLREIERILSNALKRLEEQP